MPEEGQTPFLGKAMLTINAGELCVHFQRDADRFGNAIMIGAGERTVLTSLEGSNHDVWPPSPVLQEVERFQAHGYDALLAVGMAGSSHWSMTANQAGDRAAIEFDIACRVHHKPSFLGSSYRLIVGTAVQRGELDSMDLLVNASIRLAIQSTGVVEARKDDRLILGPQQQENVEFPFTFRWKYTISLATRTTRNE